MTYFGFLLLFLGIPLMALALALARDRRRGMSLPASLGHTAPGRALLLHVVLAVVYTTPWDNHLVATGVWWYNPRLVTGVTLGWVPIEEYTFFVLQTLLTGSWLIWLGMHLSPVSGPMRHTPAMRWVSASAAGLLWLGSVAALAARWQRGMYLSLELAWMLPPIIVQLFVGADYLWKQRRLVAAALLPPVAYLCVADALAIGSGTWTINPARSTGILLAGVLPLEELVFFILTNTLIVFGMVLLLGLDRAALRAQVQRLRIRGI